MKETKREAKYTVQIDGMAYCAPVSMTYTDESLQRGIRTFPVGTFRAKGESVLTNNYTYAALLPKKVADRLASKLGGVAEIF